MDAAKLAKLARFDPELLFPIHHRDEETQLHLTRIRSRENLVQARTGLINEARGQVKALGYRLESCDADTLGPEQAKNLPEGVLEALTLEAIARVDPLTFTDACSRYLLRCQIVAHTDYNHAKGVFEAAFREFGLPAVIHSDNGVPFASMAPDGLSRLSMWFVKLGIVPERSRPASPQDNGRHERMHRTRKLATAKAPAQTLRLQQKAFDNFQRKYYGDEMELRRVSQQGSVKWKGERTYISEVFNYEALAPKGERAATSGMSNASVSNPQKGLRVKNQKADRLAFRSTE